MHNKTSEFKEQLRESKLVSRRIVVKRTNRWRNKGGFLAAITRNAQEKQAPVSRVARLAYAARWGRRRPRTLPRELSNLRLPQRISSTRHFCDPQVTTKKDSVIGLIDLSLFLLIYKANKRTWRNWIYKIVFAKLKGKVERRGGERTVIRATIKRYIR